MTQISIFNLYVGTTNHINIETEESCAFVLMLHYSLKFCVQFVNLYKYLPKMCIDILDIGFD